MRENGLMEAPERIYNFDETGISTEHAPPKIICSKESNPQAVTSERSANVTIIAGVYALGNYIPPFYVFPGKRWMDELMEGAPPGHMRHILQIILPSMLRFLKEQTERRH